MKPEKSTHQSEALNFGCSGVKSDSHVLFWISLLVCLGFASSNVLGQPRHLLSSTYNSKFLSKNLRSATTWNPFPKAVERTRWDHLPIPLKHSYVERGDEALRYEWRTLSDSLYLEYARTGVRKNFDRLYFERRQKIENLVLAECMEGKGRFLNKIVEGMMLLSEEPTWVVPAHLAGLNLPPGVPDKSNPVVDLYCGETANLVAWTLYLLGEEISRTSPLLPQRMESELRTRFLNPNSHRDDFWWMLTPGNEAQGHSINNWTPWICSNWLATMLLVEKDDAVRVQSLSRIVTVLDRFIDSYPDDGGCDEGPNYWNHSIGSLFETLELLSSATGTTTPLFSNPLVRNMGRYIYRTYVHDRYFVTISDSPLRAYAPPDLLIRYGLSIGDDTLSRFGASIAQREKTLSSGIRGSMSRQLLFLFNYDAMTKPIPSEPLLKDVWLPQTQFIAAREREGASTGFYVAAQGLHNGKSHNHNDVGNFLLYLDGEPCIIDVGPEGYNAKTFTRGRYDIWTMQSAYHNLPTINGVMQKEGKQFAARDVRYWNTGDSVLFSLDIAGAYPAEARVSKWIRTIVFSRLDGRVTVSESYALQKPAKELAITLMTSGRVIQTEANRIVVRLPVAETGTQPADVEIRFEPDKLLASVETIAIADEELHAEWKTDLQRITLKALHPKLGDTLRYTFTRRTTSQ